MAIVCPHCGWRAHHQAYWVCDECRTPFDTFEEHGACPTCGHVHELTLCPQCRVWSSHEQWYRTDDQPSWWQRVLGLSKTKKKKRDD